MSKILKLDEEDLRILQSDKYAYGKVLLIFSGAVTFIILVFGWNKIFHGTGLDKVIVSSFAALPVSLALIVYLIKNIDFLLARKRIVRGVIQDMSSYTNFGEGGSMNVTWFYIKLNDKKYSVPEGHYKKCNLGQEVVLHRTLVGKKTIRIELN